MIMLGIVGGLLAALVLLGLFHPRSGVQVLRWEPARSAELEIQNEIDDLDQMIEAANERRRRRGAPELTEESVRAGIGEERARTAMRRDEYLEELDIEQMLAVKNERRRAKGLADISAEQYRAQLERERG